MAAQARLTARSVVLSTLLGAHPAAATAAELLRLTVDFGIPESTLRVALTRLVAAGDLLRDDGGYRLSDRLLARQRRQDRALDPRLRPWTGRWTTVLVTGSGDDARTRAALRAALADRRLAELREGVWLRPDNLAGDQPWDADIAARVRVLTARDERPAELAAQLWDLPGWSADGHRLLAELAAADGVPAGFTAAAAIVRHLLTDPVLPAQLLPADWPGEELRGRYGDFVAELHRRRDELRIPT